MKEESSSPERANTAEWDNFDKARDENEVVAFIQNTILSKDGIPADKLSRFKAKMSLAYHVLRNNSIQPTDNTIIWLLRDARSAIQGAVFMSRRYENIKTNSPAELEVDFLCVSLAMRKSLAKKFRFEFLKKLDTYCAENPDIKNITFDTSARNSDLVELYSSVSKRTYDPLDGHLNPLAKFSIPLVDPVGRRISVLDAIRTSRAASKEKGV